MASERGIQSLVIMTELSSMIMYSLSVYLPMRHCCLGSGGLSDHLSTYQEHVLNTNTPSLQPLHFNPPLLNTFVFPHPELALVLSNCGRKNFSSVT